MSTERVTVHCDDAFHEGAETPLRIFTRMDGEWLIADPGDDLLLGDAPFFTEGRSLADAAEAPTRDRRRIECECSASLIMKTETIEPLLSRLADGGVQTISLRRLNLLVSTVR